LEIVYRLNTNFAFLLDVYFAYYDYGGPDGINVTDFVAPAPAVWTG
jgi:hypothetical protein